MPLDPVKVALLGQFCHEYVIAKLKNNISLDTFERMVRKNCFKVLDDKDDYNLLKIISKDASLIRGYTMGNLHKKIKFLADLHMAQKLYQCQDCLELMVTDELHENAYTLDEHGIYKNKNGFVRIVRCAGK